MSKEVKSIFSFFLKYCTVLFLSFGPLLVAELPCVEFIKHQNCQLSQKNLHITEQRGGAWEKIYDIAFNQIS